MARRYVHFSARDLEEAVLELHGLKQPSRTSGVLKAEECPRCGAKNPPDALRCNCCGYLIDKELATKMEEEERRKNEAIIARIERLEQLVRSLLSDQNPPRKFSSDPQALEAT